MSTKAILVSLGDKYNRWEITSEVFYKQFPSGSKAKFVNCRWVDRDIGNHNKSKSEGTSIYKGVYLDSRDKWVARLSRNGVIYLQKRFSNEQQAAKAYDDASEEHYGDRPNKTERE